MGIKRKRGGFMGFKKEMTCPFCRSTAKLTKYDAKLFNGELVVNGVPIYRCGDCGEEFSSSEMVDEGLRLAKEAFSKKGFNFQRQVISTGGSLAITLPTDLSKHYNLKKGSVVKVIPFSKNEIRILTKTTN